MNEIEFNISFTDVTLCESDGDFNIVKELMSQDFPVTETWMLKSDITIDSIYGISSITAHFFDDGKVKIVDYNPGISNSDALYVPAIQVFSSWAIENGWKTPEPSTDLAKGDLEFWKHHWETLLVDSDYLSDIFGERVNYTEQPED